MRKINLLLALLALTLLVACGGDAPADTTEPTAETQPESTATTAPPPTLPPEPAPTEPPAPTAEPTEAPTAEPTVPAIEPATAINGMEASQWLLMDDAAKANIADIYARGQDLGRDPSVFSIIGDSLIATPHSLAKWDTDLYALSPDYADLQTTIDQYAGSFGNYGVSVRVGLHSWSVFDPLWADKEWCEANEHMLDCEIRLNNPSVMFIFLGSNDAGSPGGFAYNMRQVVDALMEQGIVPVLATKADRFEGADNINNQLIREIAAEKQIPLLEFDLLADTIPGRGLSSDNVHLTFAENYDYNLPETFTLGYPVHNLAVLSMLDQVRQELNQ